MMKELTQLEELRHTVAQWRAEGARIALVPTMGALHRGHLALVRHAQTLAERVIVSIFVNPTQFGPNEDFTRYPRPREDDLALLRSAGADAVWLPSVETMYPQRFSTRIHVAGISAGLCGASRSGHFDGVATVVAKLLLQPLPDYAVFGEKDYQQLCVIRQLVRDLNIPVTIAAVPTMRETDGLALSSRNRYLMEQERAIAPLLYRTLQISADALNAGVPAAEMLATGRDALLAQGFSSVEYFELRAEDTLVPLDRLQLPARLLIAARLGTTRLIDNLSIV